MRERSVGDCSWATNHPCKHMLFASLEQAQAIADRICRCFDVPLIPINLVNRETKWRNGTYHFNEKIVLYPRGRNLKTLLHELAHHVAWVRLSNPFHGIAFKYYQQKVYFVYFGPGLGLVKGGDNEGIFTQREAESGALFLALHGKTKEGLEVYAY